MAMALFLRLQVHAELPLWCGLVFRAFHSLLMLQCVQKPRPASNVAQGPTPRSFNLVRRVTKGPSKESCRAREEAAGSGSVHAMKPDGSSITFVLSLPPLRDFDASTGACSPS
ncbi:hypothetical protein B0H10DRAFT_1969428 [Mycena sp. CBHHK59/15]|nr:hypothetical protein B0H10DRAFT_1970757 [Mycena sp. CBHHK59/15]KAJ6547884.1 hypothetical protein B0H10DRAFT_1969428 [Mycena sp. CBHHK59/15]